MHRPIIRLLALTMVFGTCACFLTSGGSVVSNTSDPTSGRLSQINGEIASLEEQRAALIKERKIIEEQRAQSIMEAAKLSKTGPKTPAMGEYEDTYENPGTMHIMHDQNIAVCTHELKRIDVLIANVNQKISQLKTERSQLEQKAKAPAGSPQGGPGGCFTPDTAVLTAGGRQTIVNVAAGDHVMVFDEANGTVDYRPVVNVFRFRETHYYLLNRSVRVTALHRFMTDSGWVKVQDLKIGMQLKTADGWKTLESKKLIKADVAVFNLEVAEHHDFFIAAEAEHYLVHNTGGGGK